jgi:hypothetical protein
MDKKWILVILVIGLGLALYPPTSRWIQTNTTWVIIFGALILIGILVWKKLTEKPVFLPVDTAKKNLVELCKNSDIKLGHLQTLGIGDVPVIDWGQITGYASGLKFKVENKDIEWSVFSIGKKFPYNMFTDPEIVLIPKINHLSLKPGEHVYIKDSSLVKYGKFLFPASVFGSATPLNIIKEFVGYEMFIKTLNDTGEAVTRAMLSDSEHQRQLELEKMIKKYQEGNDPRNNIGGAK